MNIEELKNQIEEKINQIIQFDLSKLYPNNSSVALWNNLTDSEIKKFVEDVASILEELKSSLNLLDTVGFNYVQNIDTHLTNFISHFGAVKDLNNDQITSQHHASLNELNSISNVLRNSALYTEIKLNPSLKAKLEVLKKINPLSKKLLANSDNLENAIEQAQEWLKTKGQLDAEHIKGQAEAFLNRAKEHKIKTKFFKWNININYWLVGAFVFSVLVGLITYSFIQASKEDLLIGQSILRISSLLVPAYLTVFCANQFLYHKRMREAYMFKYASLHTMNSLMSTHADPMKQEILKKGLNVLFSEPTTKEGGGKYNKQLVNQLFEMLRSQLK